MTAPSPAPTRIEYFGRLQVHQPIQWTPAPAPCRHCRRVHQPVKRHPKENPVSEEFKTIEEHDDNVCGETALCHDCISYLAEDGDAA